MYSVDDTEGERHDGAVDAACQLHALMSHAVSTLLCAFGMARNSAPLTVPFKLVVMTPATLRALLIADDVAVGEAYVRGDIDVEGDMIAAVEAAAAICDSMTTWHRLRGALHVLRLPRSSRHSDEAGARQFGRKYSPARDRAAVQFHYDVGNDFFQLFLDPQLQYSEAYFADSDEPLAAAQRRKLEVICRKLRLRQGERFLDVGCGWGSLVLHAAAAYGVEAVGITLSQQQHDLTRERVAAAGLADRVEIRLADYREVTEQFDAIASVGMYEHVGPDHLDGYFKAMFRLTGPGGRFLNSGITTGRRLAVVDMTREDRFLGRYVFPDGGLVPGWQVVRHVQCAGFELIDVEQLRRHYALTLRHWVRRLEEQHDTAVRTVGEHTYPRVARLHGGVGGGIRIRRPRAAARARCQGRKPAAATRLHAARMVTSPATRVP